ncbi:hypothetical protein GX51_05052 [Blastomyces parvus]|uniref:C2H2-type domain-containing protein n=1 Tax=Blastomyces parvus TaxID=2060905 RepID=A0A2B7WY54_9EURO|nr:hypothetical protein GX51_05052 [Blastomyces parvus]
MSQESLAVSNDDLQGSTCKELRLDNIPSNSMAKRKATVVSVFAVGLRPHSLLIHECGEKPAAFRTFYRGDHLCQHLRLVHGVTKFIPPMEKWKSQVTHIKSRCGFCGQTFAVWFERNDHIAHYFHEGALMIDWRGCGGLDPAVVLAVENSTASYLIGTESTGIEPFSASRLARKAIANEKPSARSVEAQDAGFCAQPAQPTRVSHCATGKIRATASSRGNSHNRRNDAARGALCCLWF